LGIIDVVSIGAMVGGIKKTEMGRRIYDSYRSLGIAIDAFY